MTDSERMTAIAAWAYDEALTEGRMIAPRSEVPKVVLTTQI